MTIWLLRRHLDGAPPVIGHTRDGVPIARGPNGEFVEFLQRPKPLALGTEPPYAAIIIHRITNDDPRAGA